MTEKTHRRLLREQGDVITQHAAEIERLDTDLELVRSLIVAEERKQQGPLLGIIISGICLIIATVGAPLAAGAVDNPTPVECSAEKDAAYDLWIKTDVWTGVPANSPTQDQCDVNGYMEYVIDQAESATKP